jgi:hypothetical protein
MCLKYQNTRDMDENFQNKMKEFIAVRENVIKLKD